MFTQNTKLILIAGLLVFSSLVNGASLQDLRFAELPGAKAEIRMLFDSVPNAPQGYTIEQPARIVLDFSSTTNSLSQKKYSVSVGEVDSAVVLDAGGKTRLIINLSNLAPYTTRIEGEELVVEIGADASKFGSVAVHSSSAGVVLNDGGDQAQVSSGSAITLVDFRRGEIGEGKVIISLTNPGVDVDIQEVANGVEVRFLDTELPESLRRKLDVLDFATPVSMVSTKKEGGASVIHIAAGGEYDYLAYQADSKYVVSVKPLSKAEVEEKKSRFTYVGDKLSLNFQDIQVRSVLQLIADFTDLNLVASDTVSGSITLRLENVPWDQALDLVLKTKGLDKRQVGSVLMVAPAAEIAARERQEIETQKQLQELAPLRTEYIRVRYANARELFNLFIDTSGGGAGDGGGASGGAGAGNERNSTGSILSERGQAIVDERTNSIILTDTEEKIDDFRRLVDRIDIPVRQVMIEARIVIANSDFRKELGVRMAGDAVETSVSGDTKFEMTGRLTGLVNGEGAGPESLFVDTDGDGITDDERSLVDSSLVDLGVFNPAGAFTWNVISSNFLLGMELSALEDSGYAEIVSQPKVITGDKQKASIESGTEIPYQEESASGGTTTSFKEAVLKLEVTPQITPDNRVIMDLVINQDSISSIDANSGIPVIDITQLETQVLVADGETIVLGGIYTTNTFTGETKVPLLGDIPFVGKLFRNDFKSEDKREILIFITPRIMASNFTE
ncbi:type IV pilus secretin PilQ family protein [Saccharophagus degradans]|uniref:Type IV pilus secretin PilQ family protein n=1 Tax=Saccharophagus degradans TaxID=86304 RepID=A0AAW7X4F6_9GAMM|nr:type IV pilus secretin PilQ family protein [Saccharophagus degradans]MDO6422523.1 type IV pilus secretin PilQ family protein [Saccharophagus degradans]MDO6607004.1 type IV pilus secretin PilQ family protein [Saccharophagus degradans]